MVLFTWFKRDWRVNRERGGIRIQISPINVRNFHWESPPSFEKNSGYVKGEICLQTLSTCLRTVVVNMKNIGVVEIVLFNKSFETDSFSIIFCNFVCFNFTVDEMDSYLQYIGGCPGAFALTGIAAVTALYWYVEKFHSKF